MWFFARQNALIILAIVAGVVFVAALDFQVKAILGALGAVAFVVLLLAVVFDSYKGPKR